MAGLANALEDPVRAVHHTRRADALRVVRHERVRGVAARVVGRVDAVLRRETAKAAESPSRVKYGEKPPSVSWTSRCMVRILFCFAAQAR